MKNITAIDKQTMHEIIWLGAFALAFGYIEGAVAHYLRMHFYPSGFYFQLQDIDRHTLLVELGREAATIIVLTAVASLGRGPIILKIANFVLVFAVWDIAYYMALYAFEEWPQSLFAWDVLFLIPVPWFSPVLVPIGLSLLGILGALLIHLAQLRKGRVRIDRTMISLIQGALAICLLSVIYNFGASSFPEDYPWALFLLGLTMILTGYVLFIRANWILQK